MLKKVICANFFSSAQARKPGGNPTNDFHRCVRSLRALEQPLCLNRKQLLLRNLPADEPGGYSGLFNALFG